jgi:hypothetical protein
MNDDRVSYIEKLSNEKASLIEKHSAEVSSIRLESASNIEKAIREEKQLVQDLAMVEVNKCKAEYETQIAKIKAKHLEEVSFIYTNSNLNSKI